MSTLNREKYLVFTIKSYERTVQLIIIVKWIYSSVVPAYTCRCFFVLTTDEHRCIIAILFSKQCNYYISRQHVNAYTCFVQIVSGREFTRSKVIVRQLYGRRGRLEKNKFNNNCIHCWLHRQNIRTKINRNR